MLLNARLMEMFGYMSFSAVSYWMEIDGREIFSNRSLKDCEKFFAHFQDDEDELI